MVNLDEVPFFFGLRVLNRNHQKATEVLTIKVNIIKYANKSKQNNGEQQKNSPCSLPFIINLGISKERGIECMIKK